MDNVFQYQFHCLVQEKLLIRKLSSALIEFLL